MLTGLSFCSNAAQGQSNARYLLGQALSLRRVSKIHELQDDINDRCSKTIFSFEKKILSNIVRGRLTGLFR